MDDMIETMVLSMIFEGRFYSFSPVTFLDRMELTVIRPMMYVSEAEVKGFRNKYNLPVVENPCPVDGVTKRQYAKDLVRQINLDHPGAKKRMFTAIGSEVLFLKRITFGPLSLDESLKTGEYRTLTKEEISLLQRNQIKR